MDHSASYHSGLDAIATSITPVSLEIDALAQKYLAKLESLGKDILGLWSGYQQVTDGRLRTSLSYMLCVPEKLNDLEKSWMHPESPRVESLDQVLFTLLRNPQFDHLAPANYWVRDPANIAYFETSEDVFVKNIQGKVTDALRTYFGIGDARSAEKFLSIQPRIYGVSIFSELELGIPNKTSLSYFNLNVRAKIATSNTSEHSLIKIPVLTMREFKDSDLSNPPGKMIVLSGAYQHGFTVPPDAELDNPTTKIKLVRDVICYDFSDGGQIAPIGMLLIRHLAVTKDLLAKKLNEIKSRASDLETVLE